MDLSKSKHSIKNFFSTLIYHSNSQKGIPSNSLINQKNIFLFILEDIGNGIKFGQRIGSDWIRYQVDPPSFADKIEFFPNNRNYSFDFSNVLNRYTDFRKSRIVFSPDRKIQYLDIKIQNNYQLPCFRKPKR